MLNFDSATHQYSDAATGAPYISVTQMLDYLRLNPPYPEDRGQQARGTAIHRACELAICDRLDRDGTDKRILPYVDAVLAKQAEMKIKPLLLECRMWDPADGIAGCLDLFCQIFDGQYAVIDYKSGNPARCCELQTALYVRLLRKMAGYGYLDQIKLPARAEDIRRFSMQITPERAIVREYKDPFDHAACQAVIDLYKWKKEKRT